MTTASADRARRSRRIVVAGGVLALVALFVAGAAVQVPAMEDELTLSAERALAAAQLEVSVGFSGQDATLSCAAPIDNADDARSAVEAVDGVRKVTVSESCSGADSTATAEPASVDSISSDGGTVPSATTANDATAAPTTVPTTAPVTTIPVTTSTTVAPEPEIVVLTYQKGRLEMTGHVATDAQHAALLTAAAQTIAAENITDRITVDPSIAITDGDVASLVALLKAGAVPLVAAELGWSADGVHVRGMFTDDESRAAFESAAAAEGVTPVLVSRPVASPETAAALREELNALVAETPIQFDKGETTVAAKSAAILERVAGIAKTLGDVIIQVQGHTDSEGDPGRNQTLSDQRAEAVRAELVRRGVPAADITSVGFGESQLITDANGIELRDQSRRVVFDVITIAG